MAVYAAELRTRYPEFNNAPDALVQQCIDDATLMVDAAVFGAKTDIAIKALAAHYIAINPLGEMARLDKQGKETTYWLQYQGIRKSVAAGFRVI
jgi:hypothetical protein